jgi:hypothetical protein
LLQGDFGEERGLLTTSDGKSKGQTIILSKKGDESCCQVRRLCVKEKTMLLKNLKMEGGS